MKALIVVFALLMGLGGTWWKIDNPAGTFDDFRHQAHATLQRLNKGVSAIGEDTTRLEQQEQRLQALHRQMEKLQLDSKHTAEQAEMSLSEQDGARLEPTRERLEDLQDSIDQRSALIDERLASIAARLDSLEEQLGSVAESASIDTQQRDMAADIASLRQELEASTDTGAVDAGAEDGAAAEVVASEIGGLNDRIRSLEERIRDLPEASAEASDAQQQQADLQAQIMELETRLSAAAASPDPALSDDLNQVRQAVAELASRDYVTPEDLRQQQSGKTTEYKIYFDRNSIEVTPEAARVLDSFILQERNRATAVSIFGFTDRTGPAEYNQQLALQRAQAVRSYLVQNGFDYTKFTSLTGLGEDAAARSLEDEQGDATQRIVVLYAHHR